MNKDEMINETINNIVEETKCFNCIHAPICFAQKGGVDLQLASGLGCYYYQAKIADDEIVVKKEAYEKIVGQLIEQEEIAHSYEQGYAELLQSNHFLQYKLENARQETAREILEELKTKCKELENKFSHLCKSKKECLMETCRYEGVLAVKRELYDLAIKYGIELEDENND